MSQQNDHGFMTCVCGEDLEAYRRVKFVAGVRTVAYADDEERADGVTQEKKNNGETISVKLLNAGGTFKISAAEAIGAGVDIFPANDGKVESAGTTACGKSIEAASGDGSILECYSTS